VNRLTSLRLFTVGLLTAALSFSGVPASASTSLTYDFNTSGDVDTYFNSYVSSGPVAWSSTGGISNSGSISAPGNNAAVFATKSAFSIGPIGSTYVFTAFMKSVGGGGYSGMGFTARTPSAITADGYPYRPIDALGISVHGGGFIFHDGEDDYNGSWSGSSDAAITRTKLSTIVDLLGVGSADDWYKVIFTAVLDEESKFDTKVEVWIVNSSGVAQEGSAAAIFEFNDRSATELIAAPKISSYFNLSGDRVYNFDNYSLNLAGGTSVIEEGMPVVLTDGAVEDAGALDMSGTLSAAGDSSVIERGFVYSTESEPTISDDVVVVSGTSPGSFSGTSETLPNDTYHVRAYATNTAGTSYGSEVTVEIAAGSSGGGGDNGGGDNGGGDSGGAVNGGTDSLADTGFDAATLALTSAAMVTAGVVLATRRRRAATNR
jgi:hypothetical protein